MNKSLGRRMIRLEGVGLRYGTTGKPGPMVLQDIDFSIPAGGFRWLRGASGAGKSSLMRLLHLELRPSRGKLVVLGQDIGSRKRRDLPILRRQIGMIFQDFRLMPHLTVFDNVALPLRLENVADKVIAQNVKELLYWVELDRKAGHTPAELSGGEQQRVAIARAVVAKPSLILADEPTGNLDDAQALRQLGLLTELNRLGTTVVIATHNDALVERFPGPELHLDAGWMVHDA
jgi:cell division transport system ATP-binding protein